MAAYRITGSMADAEDVAQSVFLRLAAGEGVPGEQCGQLPVSRGHQRGARPVAAAEGRRKRASGFGGGRGLAGRGSPGTRRLTRPELLGCCARR